MAGFIFPNASYIVSYNFPDSYGQQLKKLAASTNIKYTSDEDIESLNTTLGKIKYCIGVFICLEGMTLDEVKEIIKVLDKYHFNVKMFDSTNRLKSPAIIKEKINESLLEKTFYSGLESLQMPRLDELMLFSSKVILPSTIKHLTTEFRKADAPIDESQFNHVVICDSVSEDYFGRCVLKFSIDKLKVNVSEYAKWENQKIIDMVFEFMNLFIGIINHNLEVVDINARVGLPAYYDLSVTKISKTGPYIPMIDLIDKREIMCLSMGFINNKGGKIFDFGTCEFAERESELELI